MMTENQTNEQYDNIENFVVSFDKKLAELSMKAHEHVFELVGMKLPPEVKAKLKEEKSEPGAND